MLTAKRGMKTSGVLQAGGVSMLERQVGKWSGCCVSSAFGRPSPLPAAALSVGLLLCPGEPLLLALWVHFASLVLELIWESSGALGRQGCCAETRRGNRGARERGWWSERAERLPTP